MPTAVVIDGAFFLRRFSTAFPNLDQHDASHVAFGVTCVAAFHVATKIQAAHGWQQHLGERFRPEETNDLYRIFFYDCPPLTKRVHTPIGHRLINLAHTPEAQLRNAIHDRLHGTRKVAVRLGRLNDKLSQWRLKPQSLDRWKSEGFDPQDDDFELDVVQKGVDMRLGLDIAAMAYKKQVDQIVLIAADADFVPPAKLARREGIDVVLDPMGAHAAADLLQHVDGVRTCRMNITPDEVESKR